MLPNWDPKIGQQGSIDRTEPATYENLHLDLGAGFPRRLRTCEQIWAATHLFACEYGLAEAAVPAQGVQML